MRLSLELRQNAESVSQAVDMYINQKVSELELLRDDNARRQRVRQILHQKAGGIFLWVALVVEELETVQSWDVQQVIDEVPEGLDELYGRMTKQIDQHKRRDPELCRLVLLAVTLANRPLFLLELGLVSGLPDRMSGNVEDLQTVVKMCGSFLTVRDGRVFIIHQSAQDYLQKNYKSRLHPAGVA
jgi:hypothetical protein